MLCFSTALNDTASPFTMSSSIVLLDTFSKKKRVHRRIQTIFNTHHHAMLTGSEETVQLVYESHLFEKTYCRFTREHK
jgi:DNA replication and repair protein RecF